MWTSTPVTLIKILFTTNNQLIINNNKCSAITLCIFIVDTFAALKYFTELS